jgi:hypothetical protein
MTQSPGVTVASGERRALSPQHHASRNHENKNHENKNHENKKMCFKRFCFLFKKNSIEFIATIFHLNLNLIC